jgi:hypothetical protein
VVCRNGLKSPPSQLRLEGFDNRPTKSIAVESLTPLWGRVARLRSRARRTKRGGRGDQSYARDVRGRSPLFWILLTLGIGAVGLALDKVFADNTAPYEEPPIAEVGFFLFFLCGLAFVVLCTLALVRFWRGPASVALTPAVTARSLGVAIVLALLAFAATQILLYWGEDVDVRDGGGGTLVFLLAVTSAVILLALTVRAFRHRPEQPRAE